MTSPVVSMRPRVRAIACLVPLLAAACAPVRPAATPASPAAGGRAAAQGAAGATAAAGPMATARDGTRIAYEVTGTGPALLLVPGGGQTRKSWKDRGYVDRLSASYTVITMDLRGTGDSDKPVAPGAYALDAVLDDLLAVADAAGAPRFHLWGFGHGAAIGRYLAARSDRVISAVLVGTTMGPPVEDMVRGAIMGMRTKWTPMIEAQAAGRLDRSTLAPGDAMAIDGGVLTSTAMLSALVDYPVLEPAEIKAPTLWVIGAADASAMENVKAYQEKLEGTAVTLKLLDGFSYSDSFARTEPALAAVEPFLKSAPAAAH